MFILMRLWRLYYSVCSRPVYMIVPFYSLFVFCSDLYILPLISFPIFIFFHIIMSFRHSAALFVLFTWCAISFSSFPLPDNMMPGIWIRLLRSSVIYLEFAYQQVGSYDHALCYFWRNYHVIFLQLSQIGVEFFVTHFLFGQSVLYRLRSIVY